MHASQAFCRMTCAGFEPYDPPKAQASWLRVLALQHCCDIKHVRVFSAAYADDQIGTLCVIGLAPKLRETPDGVYIRAQPHSL